MPTYGPFDNGYSWRDSITIDHTKVVNTDQVDYPLLVWGYYLDLAHVNHGGKVTNLNGYDIAFYADEDGTIPLNWDLDVYGFTSGFIVAHIKVTASTTDDLTIYVFYGNASVSTYQSTRANVWTNGYAAVFHFGSGATLSAVDSAGITTAAIQGSMDAASASKLSSFYGGASCVNNASKYIRLTNNASLKPATSLSIEFWTKITNYRNYPKIVSYPYRTSGWSSPYTAYCLGLYSTEGKPYLAVVFNSTTGYTVKATNALGTTAWRHVFGTWDGSNLNMYVDGAADAAPVAASGSIDYSQAPAGDVAVGQHSPYSTGEAWDGSIDELRISTVCRSADWVATQYNNHSSPSTFYSTTLTAGSQYLGYIGRLPVTSAWEKGNPSLDPLFFGRMPLFCEAPIASPVFHSGSVT